MESPKDDQWADGNSKDSSSEQKVDVERASVEAQGRRPRGRKQARGGAVAEALGFHRLLASPLLCSGFQLKNSTRKVRASWSH